MIVVDIALFICIFMLGVAVLGHSKRLELINEEVEDWIADAVELKQRCDGHKELIEALSKSVRELNGVVEAAVKVKEETSDNKPDVKALIGGWTTDEGQARIDASHISPGMIDGKSLMNCELPNLSESAREKIFELLGVKVPEEEKPTDKYCVSIALDNGESLVLDLHDTGRILVNQGKPAKSYGKGRLYTDDEGHIYELPEGCSILGDTPYEMDERKWVSSDGIT